MRWQHKSKHWKIKIWQPILSRNQNFQQYFGDNIAPLALMLALSPADLSYSGLKWMEGGGKQVGDHCFIPCKKPHKGRKLQEIPFSALPRRWHPQEDFFPHILCFYPLVLDVFWSSVLGLTAPAPGGLAQVWGFVLRLPWRLHLPMCHVPLHLLPCSTSQVPLPLEWGFLCCQIHAWGWEIPLRISLSIRFHHSKENLLLVAESSFQQSRFPKKMSCSPPSPPPQQEPAPK